MDIKSMYGQFLIIVFSVCLITSCATDRSGVANNVNLEPEILASSFVYSAYRQPPARLQTDGVCVDEIRKYISEDYLRVLISLSSEYQIKKKKFEEFDQALLARLFASEINFSLLRPWSYQPTPRFSVKATRIIGPDAQEIYYQYTEERWKDEFVVNAKIILKREEGGFRVDNIIWLDADEEQDVRKRLQAITRTLKESQDMDGFEKLSSHLY